MGTETITKEREVEEEKKIPVCDFCGRDSDEISGFEDVLVNPDGILNSSYRAYVEDGNDRVMYNGIAPTRVDVKTDSVSDCNVHIRQTNKDGTKFSISGIENNFHVGPSEKEQHLCGECYDAFKEVVED